MALDASSLQLNGLAEEARNILAEGDTSLEHFTLEMLGWPRPSKTGMHKVIKQPLQEAIP